LVGVGSFVFLNVNVGKNKFFGGLFTTRFHPLIWRGPGGNYLDSMKITVHTDGGMVHVRGFLYSADHSDS
jgi:hypothetical protein